jgi:ribonucleoside-diphosphate reductase alpha chain
MISQKISKQIWEMKYQWNGETPEQFYNRIVNAIFNGCNSEEIKVFCNILNLKGFKELKELTYEYLSNHYCSLAGRPMYSLGTDRKEQTFSNCYVIPIKKDSMQGIMKAVSEAAITMKSGGGNGYSFSILRPENSDISTSGGVSTGPLSFMKIFDSTCDSIKGGNNRRGAQIGVLDIWHPDIEKFIEVKQEKGVLTNFNISVGISDEFMKAVENDEEWDLIFPDTSFEKYNSEWDGNIKEWKSKGYPIKVYKTVNAAELYEKIMKATYKYAEPGVLFLDTINRENNLWYDEYIFTTNPCFPGDTIIATADGRNGVTIKELAESKEEFLVYSSRKNKTRNSWKTEIKKATAFKTGYKKLLTIILSDGSKFRCTPDHLLALTDGKSYIEAKDSLGLELEKFYTYSNTKNNKSYRHINTISNGKDRQYRMIWEYYNGEYNGKEYNIDHIDNNSTNDNIKNLQLLTVEEHKRITKRHGKDNPIFKIDKEYFSLYNAKRNILGNAQRYNWSEERLKNELEKFENSVKGKRLQEIIKEREKSEQILNDRIFVEDVIDNNEFEDVYDLNVEDNHNFNIITKSLDDNYNNCSGILVHNCGEEPLPEYSSCNLGSVNYSTLVKNPFINPEFQQEKYEQSIKLMVILLNKIIDINYYPLEEQKEVAHNKRPVGLGFTGLADSLCMMKIKYSSNEGKEFTENLLKTLRDVSYKTSIEITKGLNKTFTGFDPKFIESTFCQRLPEDIRNDIVKHGIYNSRLLTTAPSGTSSIIMNNCSSGIEPIFNLKYWRKVKQDDGTEIQEPVTDYAVWLYENLYGEDAELPDYFETINDLKDKDHLDVQIIAQKYIDSSISKTINLPEDYPFEDFKDIYKRAWKEGLKGTTTYIPNEIRGSVLSAEVKEEKQEFFDIWKDHEKGEVIKESVSLPSEYPMRGFKIISEGRKWYIQVAFKDKAKTRPFAIFVSTNHTEKQIDAHNAINALEELAIKEGIETTLIEDNKKKSNNQSNVVKISRAIGLLLRHNVKIEKIVNTLDDLDIPINSLIYRLKVFLSNYIVDKNTGILCPECEAELQLIEGCKTCPVCFWSKCG